MNILVSGLLAFCSLGYSFVFSHLLAVTLGSTIIQYCISLGLYISSLGLGSIFFDHVNQRKKDRLKTEVRILFLIEGLICLTAFAGCFFIVFNNNFAKALELNSLQIFSYLPTIVLGFLSGMELPFLIDYGDEKESKWILASDFLGMALMCVAFGFFIVPWFGFVQALMIFIGLNFSVLILLLLKRSNVPVKFLIVGSAVVFSFLLIPDWEAVVRELYVRGG